MDVGLAIGGEIVVARRARGMSQETLAIAAGVSRSTIQRVERGLVSSGETMLSVCAALGLDHAELLRAAERALPVERPPQGAECGFPVPGAGDLPPVSPRDIGTVGVGMVLTLGAAYPGGRFMQAHLVGGGTPWTQWWVEAAVSLVIAALTMAALAAASRPQTPQVPTRAPQIAVQQPQPQTQVTTPARLETPPEKPTVSVAINATTDTPLQNFGSARRCAFV